MQRKVRILTKQQANKLAATVKRNQSNVSEQNHATDDPDAPPLTDYQLTQFKPFLFKKAKLRQ